MGYQNWNTSDNQRFSDRNYATQEMDDYSLMDSQTPGNYNASNRFDQNSSNMRSHGQYGTIGRSSYGKNPYEQRYSEYPGSFSSDSDRSQGRYSRDHSRRMNSWEDSGRSGYEPSYSGRGNYGSSFYDDMGNQNFSGNRNSNYRMRSREELYGGRSNDDMAYQGRGFGGGLDRNYNASYPDNYDNSMYGRDNRDYNAGYNSRNWRSNNENERSFNGRMGYPESHFRNESRSYQMPYNQDQSYGRSMDNYRSGRNRFSPFQEEGNHRGSEGRYGMGRGNQGWDNYSYGMRSGQRNESDEDNYGRGYYNNRSYGTEGDYSQNW